MLRSNLPNQKHTNIIKKRMKTTIVMIDEYYCENCKCYFCISVNFLNYCPECGAKNNKEKGTR